ncbi:TonB-dependent receptor domain-containing protein [Sphingobium lignivorans]|uniref:TonB-dependent receptor domain-containing protein n=1 Tax=Sphingobium lignivorans TaxID=2735886 RepID=UPI00160730E4|nr:TonB-dependent receptor [Sphingobium lignivorans]
MATAIAELGKQAQVEILLNAPGQENSRTPAIRGRMTVEEALKQLLRDKRLTFRPLSASIYLIEPGGASRSRSPALSAAKNSEGVEGSDIVVTARRRVERAMDVPLAVTRVTASQMVQQQTHSLADLSRILPGFVATGQGSSATPLLVMRGQRRSFAEENRLPLVVYVDEVPLPNQAALSPLFDVASVEVLRGPQGTLFGRSATAGAVLVRSAMPEDGVPSYVEYDVGNYGQHRLEGAMDADIAPAVSLRVAGQMQRRDGFFRLVHDGRADDAHTDAIRAILKVQPLDDLRSTSTFELLNGDETGSTQILVGAYPAGNARTAANAPYFDCGEGNCDIDSYVERQAMLGGRTSQSGLKPQFRRRFRSFTNITEYGDANLMLRNIVGWRSVQQETALDGDATPLPINDVTTITNLHQWSEEFQVQGRSAAVRYIAGAFYLGSAPSGPMLQHAAQFERPGNPATNIANYQSFRSAALFGQATVDLSGGRSVDIGLRYTSETIKGCSLRSITEASQSSAACAATGGSLARIATGQLTWTVALSQKVDNATFYLTSRKAFRSGGYNSPQLGGTLEPFQVFQPETLTDVEAGVKGSWSGPILSGDYAIAAYTGFYANIQRALFAPPGFDGDDDPTNDPITLYVNLAQARISGLDGEFTARLGRNVKAGLSLSYVSGGYDRVYAPAALDPLLGSDPRNNRFSYAPGLSASIWASHRVRLPDTLGSIEISGDYSYRSLSRYAERVEDRFAVQPGYGLLGAGITWYRIAGTSLDANLWVRNLTDKSYASGGVMLNPTFSVASVIPGPPRTWGLRLRYSFD